MNQQRIGMFILAIVVTGVAGVVAGIALTGKKTPDPPAPRYQPKKIEQGMEKIPASAEGILDPPLVTAAEARMPGDELVLGFANQGNPFAIRKSSLAAFSGHIQRFSNVGGHSLTIVHCDLSNCTRTFDGIDNDFSIIGFHHGKNDMILDVSGERKPLQSIGTEEFVEVSWDAWKKLHPGTLVMHLDGPNLDNLAKRRAKTAKE